MDKLPTFTVDLIKQLDEQIPERCPDIKLTEKEIWYYAGQRYLVRGLVNKLRQEEKELTMLD